MTSVIPITILANMNTKIILNNDLYTERNAIIQSTSQELSTDDRTLRTRIKALSVPIKIPLFEDLVLRDSQTTGIIKKLKLGVIG
jgi:hypothetical protein